MDDPALAGLRTWVADLVRQEVARALAGVPPDAKVPGPYLTTAEAAELARVTSGTIRRWIAAGVLEPHRAGREIRVRMDQLAEAMRPRHRRSRLPASMVSPEEGARRVHLEKMKKHRARSA